MTLKEIDEQIKALEKQREELKTKERERLEKEKAKRIEEINNAYKKYVELKEKYFEDYDESFSSIALDDVFTHFFNKL